LLEQMIEAELIIMLETTRLCIWNKFLTEIFGFNNFCRNT
jgi:hypothetical protein